jgi:hypothetical protein
VLQVILNGPGKVAVRSSPPRVRRTACLKRARASRNATCAHRARPRCERPPESRRGTRGRGPRGRPCPPAPRARPARPLRVRRGSRARWTPGPARRTGRVQTRAGAGNWKTEIGDLRARGGSQVFRFPDCRARDAANWKPESLASWGAPSGGVRSPDSQVAGSPARRAARDRFELDAKQPEGDAGPATPFPVGGRRVPDAPAERGVVSRWAAVRHRKVVQ